MPEREASWIYGPSAEDEGDEDGLSARERRALVLESGEYDTERERDDDRD